MKKIISIMLLVLLVAAMFCTPVLAAETTKANGFYNIGTIDDVEITPYAEESKVSATNQDVNNDTETDKWYINSDRLEVSYTAAVDDGYYGVILVAGRHVPTKDDEIYYIDQVTAESNTVEFNVWPILPKTTTDLTIYISSDVEGSDLVSIPLSYVVGAEVTASSYELGDVDDNGEIAPLDAQLILKYIVNLETLTENQLGAADIDKNGEVAPLDAQRILKHIVNLESIYD